MTGPSRFALLKQFGSYAFRPPSRTSYIYGPRHRRSRSPLLFNDGNNSEDEFDLFFDTDGDFDWSLPLSDDTEGPDVLEKPAEVGAKFHPEKSFTSTYEDAAESSLTPVDIGNKTLAVIQYMKRNGLPLGIMLNVIFWGNDKCTSDPSVRTERTAFLSRKFFCPS